MTRLAKKTRLERKTCLEKKITLKENVNPCYLAVAGIIELVLNRHSRRKDSKLVAQSELSR